MAKKPSIRELRKHLGSKTPPRPADADAAWADDLLLARVTPSR
jgi:hypothetical protein